MRQSAALVAVSLLALSGCLGGQPDTRADGTSTSMSGQESALSAWPFSQGAVDGSRTSHDQDLTLANLPTLGVAWNFTTRGAVTGTPTVQSGHVFVETWKGIVYSLSAANGSLEWSHDVGAQGDGSVTLAGGLALVGDAVARLHALDMKTGDEVWSVLVDGTLRTHLYSTPLVVPALGARPSFIVQGVGSDQESIRLHGDAPVDFRGQVAAYWLSNGTLLWRTMLVPPGLTGATVWGTPVYDVGSDRIVFGTGNAYTPPAGNLTDSIVALSAADGHLVWHVQALTGDVFTQKVPINPDLDFGATPTLFTAGNRTLAGIGQKSGVFWAVDMATGAVKWKHGTSQGGQGILADGAQTGGALVVSYVTLAKIAVLEKDDGALRWERPLRGLGFSDPVGVPGAAVVADTSGWVHGFDVASGNEVWNASVGPGNGVFGGLSVAEGKLFVPLVTGGFLGAKGGVVAFTRDAVHRVNNQAVTQADNVVRMTGYAFQPRVRHIHAGESVNWKNEDPEAHTVTAIDASFDVSVQPSNHAELKFDHAGTFDYYCKPHSNQGTDGKWQGMTGSIIVE